MNNIQKVLLCAMAAGVSAGFFASCDEDDSFDINSPDWLASRIDSIAQSKNNNASGDTTVIELSNTTVGETNNSSGWWTAFSDVMSIPSGKKLTVEFDNYGTGENNWNNWNLAVTNAKATSTTGDENYKEYFVLRSDAYGWVGGMGDEGYAYDAANITTNYAEAATAAGNDDQWAYFRSVMQGAHVVMEIQHVTAGYVYVTVTATATDGTVIWEKYHQTCSASDDIFAFLVCDGSHFENMKAVQTPATIVISESLPARLELSNCPAFLALGDTAYNAGVTAKVYFEDGTSADADSADLSFVAPDLTTTGVKTVTVLYNKTSRGNYCSPIYASYTLQVTDFGSIEVEVADNVEYFFMPDVESVPFIAPSAKVYGVGGNGDKSLLDNSTVKFSSVASDGSFTADYQGLTFSGTVPTMAASIQVGASDFSSGWWTVFSDDYQVKNGETITKKLQIRSDNLENWHGLCVVLRTAEKVEYGVARADNFGWGTGYDAAANESDWNFDTFASNIDGSVCTLSLTNSGETVDVVMDFIDASGDAHTQKYVFKTAGTAQADADDVYFSMLCEESYLLIE
ncbi:MAG: hypothetical protein ACI35Q_05620 [Marinilabiliaceae bacterium]